MVWITLLSGRAIRSPSFLLTCISMVISCCHFMAASACSMPTPTESLHEQAPTYLFAHALHVMHVAGDMTQHCDGGCHCCAFHNWKSLLFNSATFRAGCPGRTVFVPSGDLLCPRWCVTYKKGRSSGRHGCFGRTWYDEIQPTVVGRAEPHNLALLHPSAGLICP